MVSNGGPLRKTAALDRYHGLSRINRSDCLASEKSTFSSRIHKFLCQRGI